MKNESQNKIYDGQNRCRRCNRPLSNPEDIYGWKCAQIVGLNKYNEIAHMLDEDSLKSYDAYISKYLSGENQSSYDNGAKIEKIAFWDSLKDGASWVGDKLHSLWNWGEDNIWKSAAAALDVYGYHLTADLLRLSADGSDNYYAPPGSYASELLKNDKVVSKAVNDIIWERGTSQGMQNISTEPISYEIPLGNGDIGAALHYIDIQVNATQQNDGAWYANVGITDTFDFTELINPLKQDSVIKSVLWGVNDIAYYDTKLGFLDSVDVRIEFNDFY